MADLSPDLSPYAALARPQSGLANMDPSSILGLVQHSRELNTQQAISDALKNSYNPTSGQIDYTGALKSLIGSGAYLTPQNTSDLAAASKVVSDVKIDQLRKVSDLISYQADDPNLSHDSVNRLATAAVRGGVPAEQVGNFLSTLPAPSGNKNQDRQALKKALIDWQVTLTGGHPPAAIGYPTAAGGTLPVSPAESAYIYRGIAPAPGSTQTPGVLPSAGGRPTTTLPGATETQLKTSGEMGAGMLASGPERAQTRAFLDTLEGLGKNVDITGPTAEAEKALKQEWHRFFGGGEDDRSAKELASGESYEKIANILAAKQAVSNHATDLFLHNSYGSNPNLQLSKLGRTGITHWLQGNVDAEATVAKEWSDWITNHPGQQGLYLDWLNGKAPDSTMDINKFDPRVFQYARMSPSERAEFRSQMGDSKGKKQLTFLDHVDEYRKRGWIDLSQ